MKSPRIPSHFIGLAVALLFFLFWVFQPADREVERAFYVWENTKTELTEYEQKSLEKLEVTKLYLKFFEVEKNDVYGIYPTAKSQLGEYGIEKENFEIVPTIYVRNEVFKKPGKNELEEFASNLGFLIRKKMSEKFPGKQLQEIQIDCDWTESTQKNYFKFLRLLKKHTDLKISATLRLYAYKFPDKMGVLPVDRAMLMCYNLLSVHQQENKNSILDLEELEKYLVGAGKYPVPLDVALPVYSAMHVYRNNSYTTTLYNDGQLDAKVLSHTKGLWYRVNTDVPLQTLFLREGDKVKYEKVSPEMLERAIRLIRSRVSLERDFTLSFFQLNEYELKQHSDEKLASYYQLF
ncbi:MAG: hypothetical protein K0R65_1855 [Crocinitomicaceae bacterium]|jgi:hypothetical protein|nr:hypothetical protein [Crocinitomicaceae bacterium]